MNPKDCCDDEKAAEPCMANRQETQDMLRQRARGMREKARALEMLADELERRRFSPEADSVLFEMIAVATNSGRF